jgi:hypothetical protein
VPGSPSGQELTLTVPVPPWRRAEGGGSCGENEKTPSDPTFNDIGLRIVPSQFKGVAEPDLYMAGSTGTSAHPSA